MSSETLEQACAAWARMFRRHAGSQEDVVAWLQATLPRCGWPRTPNDELRSLLWRYWRERWRDDMRVAERSQRERAENAKRKRAVASCGRSIWDLLNEPGGF